MIAAAGLAALALAAAAPTPEQIQALYEGGRARNDWAAVHAAERLDERPAHLRVPGSLPRVPDRRAHPPGTPDAPLSLALERLGRSFDGWAAFWVHDLRTGRTAGWNSDARFPAASTVKLAVLDAALRRYRDGRGSIEYDLRQIGAWSSNVAANRLYGLVGSAETYASLARLGMHSSTYTGPYRAGTSFDAPKPPPLDTGRVTTAHDLGRALFRLQHERSRELRYLRLAWPGSSILRGGLPRETEVAEKDGWLDDFRASAVIAYLPRAPKIVVVLAYRPGLELREARALGRRVGLLVSR